MIATLSTLAGCAVGPKYVKPNAPINASWSASADGRLETRSAADSAWWRSFADTTLDRLVRMAYHQNLPLQIAGARIMEARAQLGVATGGKYPQVQAIVGNATAVGLSEHAVLSSGFDRYFWDYALGFDAAWELDFWGRARQTERAAAADYLASIADYDDALVSLTAEVARTYTVIRTLETLILQARANVALQEEGLRIARSRFRNGATSELDVSQATTLLQSTRATVPELESSLQQSENALTTLLGQPTGSLASLMSVSQPIPGAPAQVSISMPAELLRRRPDIRGAEASAMAQIARIGVAKVDRYPSFTLFGRVGTQTSSAAGPAISAPLFSSGSLFYFFGPRLVWSLLDWGRTKNNVRVQDARYEEMVIGYRNTVLKAAQEVEDGATGYLKSQQAAVYADSAARAAARSADLASRQYREGAVDYQRVLDAQRSLLEEQNTQVRTQASIATNLISLYKALGGGWQMRQGQPFLPDSMQTEMRNRTNWGDFLSQPSDSTSNHR